MEWNSRLFWTGAGIGAIQLLIYFCCSTAYRKTVPLGPAWTSQNHATLDHDASVLTIYLSQWQGGIPCPPRISQALHGGDTVHITHYEFGFFPLEACPSFTIYRVEGLRVWRVYAGTPDFVQFAGMVASLLIPTLVLVLIAIERQVGFLPS